MISKYQSSFIIILLWFISPIYVSAQESFSLSEAIDYAIDNQRNVKQALLDIQDAEAQIKETRAIGYPKLDAQANYQRFLELPTSILPGEFQPLVDLREIQDLNGERFFLGVTRRDENGLPVPGPPLAVQFGTKHNLDLALNFEMLIFEGSYIVGLQTAKIYREFAELNVDQVEYELKENVTKAFYNVALVIESMDIVAKDVLNLEKLLEESKAIYEEGFIEKLDVDRLEYSLRNLKIQENNLSQLLLVNKNILKLNMGYPIDQNIDIMFDSDDIISDLAMLPKDSPQEYTLTDRPDYVLAQKNMDILSQNIKRYKYQYYPSLSIFGSYNQTLQGDVFSESEFFPTTVVGARLNVPIYDGRDKRSKIERAQISLDKADLDIQELERYIALQVNNTFILLRNALNTFQLAEENVDLARHIYETSQIKYREGVGSSVELRQAEADLYASQNQWIQAKYDLINAKVDYDQALGKL